MLLLLYTRESKSFDTGILFMMGGIRSISRSFSFYFLFLFLKNVQVQSKGMYIAIPYPIGSDPETIVN